MSGYVTDGHTELQQGLDVGDHQIRQSGSLADPGQAFRPMAAAAALNPPGFKVDVHAFPRHQRRVSYNPSRTFVN